jgi:hypothetical protein
VSDRGEGLLAFRRNVYSQGGEDGVLEKVFETLGIDRGWCVEFGAWDGMHLSNTFNFIKNHGWSAVLIEGDARKAQELRANMKPFPGVTCVNQFVNFDGLSSLDNILAATAIPKDFDLLSIDIDGADYHVWKSLMVYRPKAVIIEFNQTIPDGLVFIQARDMAVHQGSSLGAMIELANEKGYELAATTNWNAIFVRAEFLPLFAFPGGKAPVTRDHDHETHLIQGFDGTVHIMGCRRLIWHNIEIREGALQVLPRWVRFFPDVPQNVPFWRKALLGLWKRLSRLLYAAREP